MHVQCVHGTHVNFKSGSHSFVSDIIYFRQCKTRDSNPLYNLKLLLHYCSAHIITVLF